LQAALGDAYRIEKELGGGGMSRLFLATDASLQRQVVIKLLPPEFASEVSAARFKQERAAAPLVEQFVGLYMAPTEGYRALLRGRVNERLGNRDKAIAAYRFVAAVWRNADPKLQPYVAEARAALQRLSSEPR